MSLSNSNFNRLPIEYITFDAATPLAIILLGFIQVFVCAILGWDNKIYAYFLGPSSSSSSNTHVKQSNPEVKPMKKTEEGKRVYLNKGDLEIVFKRLGLFHSWDFGGNYTCGAIPTKRFKVEKIVEKTEEVLYWETVSELFDGIKDDDATAAAIVVEMEEVKAAFDVYDENKDGFIDEFELQKVLCGLGFKEGLKIDNCRKMIVLADNNGDGRLDFNEFKDFLQNNL